ncbi:MAG: cupin domain-containing protein [Rhodospirillales bacterium]|nr:cupin domain-containing protein [Rhodospirillales bacterium]
MTAERFDALNAAVVDALRQAATQPFMPRPELETARTRLEGLSFTSASKRPPHPMVARELESAAVRHADARKVHHALIDASPFLTWNGAERVYGREPGMEAFCASYAFAALAAPASWVGDGGAASSTVGLSFTVQGPGVTYPPHAHKAVELYYIIAGKGLWKCGDEPWIERYPGEVILHTAGMRHAMRTLDQPLVSLAIWITDVDSPIAIVRA